MSQLGFKIIVSDSWIKGQADPVPHRIEDLAGEPVFLLVPTDDEERLAIARRAGYCDRCEGEGRIPGPLDRRGQPMLIRCPRCEGKGKPMLSPEVMRAICAHICRGWQGWISAEGSEIPYSPEMRDRVAVHRALFAVIVSEAQRLKIRYEEEAEDFFASSREPSSGESQSQTPSQEPTPSSGDGGSSGTSKDTTSGG